MHVYTRQCDQIWRNFYTWGKFKNSLAIIKRFFYNLHKFWAYFDSKMYVIGWIFIVVNCQNPAKKCHSGHTHPRSTSQQKRHKKSRFHKCEQSSSSTSSSTSSLRRNCNAKDFQTQHNLKQNETNLRQHKLEKWHSLKKILREHKHVLLHFSLSGLLTLLPR